MRKLLSWYVNIFKEIAAVAGVGALRYAAMRARDRERVPPLSKESCASRTRPLTHALNA